MFMPMTHYAAATSVASSLTEISSAASGVWTGYSDGTGPVSAPSVGSIASGGPLLSIATFSGLYHRSDLGRLYLDFVGDVGSDISAAFTKMTIDTNDWLFSANAYGGSGVYSGGHTIFMWTGVGSTPVGSGSNYDILLV